MQSYIINMTKDEYDQNKFYGRKMKSILFHITLKIFKKKKNRIFRMSQLDHFLLSIIFFREKKTTKKNHSNFIFPQKHFFRLIKTKKNS